MPRVGAADLTLGSSSDTNPHVTRSLFLLPLCLVACSEGDSSGAAANPSADTPTVSEPAVSAKATPGLTATSTQANIAPPDPHARSLKPKAAPPGEKYVYPKTRFVWIRQAPGDTAWIGYLWIGGYAKLKSGKPRWGAGCSTWYELDPFGFVCVDGKNATVDPEDPELLAALPYAPNLNSPWPHQYAESRNVVKYKTVPTAAQRKKREWDYAEHRARLEAAKTGKVDDAVKGVVDTPASGKPIVFPELPSTIHEPRNRLLPLSTVAYSYAAIRDGLSALLTADYRWVPKDRVAPYKKVTFQGLNVKSTDDFPLAFFREKDQPKYKKTDTGFEATSAKWKRLSHVKLTGKTEKHAGETYYETADSGLYTKKKEAVIPKLAEQTPWEARVGGKDETGKAPKGRATWIEANVWKGWLIAYEGTKPVYVTLISPGRGGTPCCGKTALETAATPTGSFKITGKFATATMVAPGEFIHSDVPWTQNFSGPHAIHGAYWHDRWGERMSAGCVNVSPRDGKWLFAFTEPKIPDGWHGVKWRPGREYATSFIVR